MKFFAAFALIATSSAVTIEQQQKAISEIATGMEVVEFVQTLNKIETELKRESKRKPPLKKPFTQWRASTKRSSNLNRTSST